MDESEFETHLTVRADDPVTVESAREWAAARDLKFHHIVLDGGSTPSQPMLTLRNRGQLQTCRAAAEELAAELSAAGFMVSRVKIEAEANGPLAPTAPGCHGTRGACERTAAPSSS
jgi:hypothetical protein